jgi:hypothetical protein
MTNRWILKIFISGEFAYSATFSSEQEASEYCNSMHSARLQFELVKL